MAKIRTITMMKSFRTLKTKLTTNSQKEVVNWIAKEEKTALDYALHIWKAQRKFLKKLKSKFEKKVLQRVPKTDSKSKFLNNHNK